MKFFWRSRKIADLHTRRLRLVAMTPEMLTAELEHKSWLGTLLRTTQPNEWPPKDFEPHVVRMIQQQAQDAPDKRGWHRYVIWDADGDAVLVGCIGAFPKPDNIAEIGYSTLPNFQRRGFATEAVRCLVDYLLEQDDVRAVKAQAFTQSEESFKVMRAAGLTEAGEGDDPGTLQYLRTR